MQMGSNLIALGPCIIGATGGSGTRAVARVVRAGGLYIGSDLNESEDALGFAAYSDRWINTFVTLSDSRLWPLLRDIMRRDLQNVLERHLAPLGSARQAWGWKEPRSIYLWPFFHEEFPEARFLHIVRDGRDMAFSWNQHQLKKHGRLLGVNWAWRRQALRSAELWRRVNMQAADFGETVLRARYRRIRFEDLCAQPTTAIRSIFGFLGLEGDVEGIAQREVAPPTTLGRWREHDATLVSEIRRIAGAALERFGYLQSAADADGWRRPV